MDSASARRGGQNRQHSIPCNSIRNWRVHYRLKSRVLPVSFVRVRVLSPGWRTGYEPAGRYLCAKPHTH
jgi:hypothetical protein